MRSPEGRSFFSDEDDFGGEGFDSSALGAGGGADSDFSTGGGLDADALEARASAPEISSPSSPTIAMGEPT